MHFSTKDEVKAHILYKLARKGRWGAKHTEFIHCTKSLPREWEGKADELAQELIDEGLLLQWRKTGQFHVSLNPRKGAEIKEFVGAHLGAVFW